MRKAPSQRNVSPSMIPGESQTISASCADTGAGAAAINSAAAAARRAII
jgi:hypothetical protein